MVWMRSSLPRVVLLCLCLMVCINLNIVRATSSDGLESTNTYESQLKTALLQNYDYRARPVIQPSDAVNVTVQLAFQTIVEVNMKNGIVQLVIWMRQDWTDPFLAWTEASYDNLAQIGMNSSDIWTPNLVVLNESQKFLKDLYPSNIYSYSNGYQYWSRPGRFAFSCVMTVRHFPFDVQTCSINIGSWDFSGWQQDINIMGDGYQDLGMTHQEWEVTKFTVVRSETFYACCPTEPWPEISFSFTMERKPNWYIQYLVFPTVTVLMMSSLSFFIHIQTGERTRLVVLSNLTLISLMFISKDQLPVTSESTIIGDFFMGCIFFNLIIYMENVVCNYLFYKPRTRRVGMTAGFGTSFLERFWSLPKWLLLRMWEDRKQAAPLDRDSFGPIWAEGYGPVKATENDHPEGKQDPYYDQDTPYHFDPSDPVEPMRAIKVREMQADKLRMAIIGENIDKCFTIFAPITFMLFNTILFTIGASNLKENQPSATADTVIYPTS